MFRRLLAIRPALVTIPALALVLSVSIGIVAAGFAFGSGTDATAMVTQATAATTSTIPSPAATTPTDATPAETPSEDAGSAGEGESRPVETTVKPPAPPSSTTTTEAPVFEFAIEPIGPGLQKELKDYKIWRPGSPVSFDKLRVLQVKHWDFEGKVRTGRLVIHRAWADEVATVFAKLFEAHFPIRRMDPIDALKTKSNGIAAWDNTESYQARSVNGGWSMHAYGAAVDINPAENPWVRPGRATVPAVGADYRNRSADVPGLIVANSVVVKAFKAIGWKWGGDWSSSKDYMHFSYNGH